MQKIKQENIIRMIRNKGEIWEDEGKTFYTLSENLEKAGEIWKTIRERQIKTA